MVNLFLSHFSIMNIKYDIFYVHCTQNQKKLNKAYRSTDMWADVLNKIVSELN